MQQLRLVCNRRKYNHMTPLLSDLLHWVPVQNLIDYKLALIIYKSLQRAAPEYLSTWREGEHLQSEVKVDLKVRKSKTCFGDRAFSVAGPRCWNNIPTSMRSAPPLDFFKPRLKTRFFETCNMIL